MTNCIQKTIRPSSSVELRLIQDRKRETCRSHRSEGSPKQQTALGHLCHMALANHHLFFSLVCIYVLFSTTTNSSWMARVSGDIKHFVTRIFQMGPIPYLQNHSLPNSLLSTVPFQWGSKIITHAPSPIINFNHKNFPL